MSTQDALAAGPAASVKKPSVMSNPNFRWLCAGSIMTMVGDQFTLVALPLLVLSLTSDPLALGLVFALIGVPRAIFILIGGATVDHFSPQRVLMLTKYVNTALLGILAALVVAGRLELWMLYVLSTALGLSTAFSIPSTTAMLPHALPPELLPAANGMMLGLRQLSMFLGPLLAGLLIAVSAGSDAAHTVSPLVFGLAFGIDAFTFAASAWTLAKVVSRPHAAAAGGAARKSVMGLVAEGLAFCWNDKAMRVCFFYGAAIAFFVSGPMQVAVPLLAVKMNNPSALGMLMGAHGAGTLLGMAMSGTRPGWRLGSLGATILLLDCVAAVLFMPLGDVRSVWTGSALLLGIGALSGFLQVALFSWIQKRVPLAMMGRAMSLFMFVAVGVAPISASLTGWVLRQVSLSQLFMGSGALLLGTVLIAALSPSIRAIKEQDLVRSAV